ncbi:MAG: PAS domain-containing protein [Epsilonproteobacteria bacterium]|nr:PAS domain-containing protein [Campylobacterota bacterium]OIO16239.1 MAG: PAS sensor protein [Helicobacteraceae bacterium CG1_02_36_14]PIP09433.1 MAG: PAS sensor protein [Sulfurimonas sp. CG23_combo_of_CG06-09_8_20_14_all_36_33]PIS24556.1 MAG: PAS sensor protein [Sulfurimonas sp. CG08_land_8_20_14_0_20_36_33]PIU35761.1 MAG: PAS sensor protein [Sulfurimonas sp. CG07_land_8_20_14_0_80_36_56]PIV05038.1 MAG: PAS sensor protein [Sulfurimonas sp. CG03_land_8_20_14_0_80_36_25]PIV35131.1 MAG: PAS 
MEIIMKESDFIVSKTDLKGHITYGNEIFISMSGYEEKELLNAPHNILRHPDMPAVVFKLLWQRIKNKQPINAYVKNQCKNGDYYWVFANVTPSVDERGNTIGYYSVRRKPNAKAVQTIALIYADLLKSEKQGGVSASEQLLDNLLNKQGLSYDEFIINLQQ